MVLAEFDWCMQNNKQTNEKMKLDHQITPFTIINSKWVKDLNINHDTIKVLEENIGSKISDIPHSNIFSNIFSRAIEMKGKKWNYIN